MTKLTRTITMALTTAAVASTALVTAAPAQAASATQCKTSSKNFALPGKPDVRVSATICIQRTGVSGGYRHYKAWLSKVSWDGTSSYIGWGDRFNNIDFLARAEHGRTAVKNCSYGICEWNNLTTAINNSEKGSKTFRSDSSGYGIAYVTTKRTNWTADATGTFDIADDGIAQKNWQLAGTRSVH